MVIVVLAVLMGLLLPAFARARAAGHGTAAKTTLRSLYVAVTLYAEDADGFGPITENALDAALRRRNEEGPREIATVAQVLGPYGVTSNLLQTSLDPSPPTEPMTT